LDEHVLLEYLGSRKGVKVNGHRAMSASLKHGDTFEVGETIFTVNDLEQGSSASRPKVPQTVVERNAGNRLFIKRDPKVRAIFDRACELTATPGDAARAVPGVLELVLDLSGAQRCFFLWFGSENGVRVVASLAQDGNTKGPKLNGALVGTVARIGAPMLKVDERALSPEATSGDRPSAMCAPLRVNKQVVGAVYADSGWSDGKFTTHTLQDLRALVEIVGPLLLKIGTGACNRN
jgi:hypothetical protein